MTAPMPLFRMRTDEGRRAWLEGWLSAYNHIAEDLEAKRDGRTTEILAASFKGQLEEMIRREEARTK